jgi:hypothetical protein
MPNDEHTILLTPAISLEITYKQMFTPFQPVLSNVNFILSRSVGDSLTPSDANGLLDQAIDQA